jgi:hypothetical protein
MSEPATWNHTAVIIHIIKAQNTIYKVWVMNMFFPAKYLVIAPMTAITYDE